MKTTTTSSSGDIGKMQSTPSSPTKTEQNWWWKHPVIPADEKTILREFNRAARKSERLEPGLKRRIEKSVNDFWMTVYKRCVRHD